MKFSSRARSAGSPGLCRDSYEFRPSPPFCRGLGATTPFLRESHEFDYAANVVVLTGNRPRDGIEEFRVPSSLDHGSKSIGAAGVLVQEKCRPKIWG